MCRGEKEASARVNRKEQLSVRYAESGFGAEED